MTYSINWSPRAGSHLDLLTARQARIVITAVETHLAHQPMLETRNRKKMRENPLASWELRTGDLRIFYDVDPDDLTVSITAVGLKKGNTVYIAGKAIELGYEDD